MASIHVKTLFVQLEPFALRRQFHRVVYNFDVLANDVNDVTGLIGINPNHLLYSIVAHFYIQAFFGIRNNLACGDNLSERIWQDTSLQKEISLIKCDLSKKNTGLFSLTIWAVC